MNIVTFLLTSVVQQSGNNMATMGMFNLIPIPWSFLTKRPDSQERGDKKWQRSLVEAGNKALRRIPYEEW